MWEASRQKEKTSQFKNELISWPNIHFVEVAVDNMRFGRLIACLLSHSRALRLNNQCNHELTMSKTYPLLQMLISESQPMR